MKHAEELPQHAKPKSTLQEIDHDVQVTSFGGSGTTMLLHFLAELDLSLPPGEDWGIFKHQRHPPTPHTYRLPPNFRAIYLLANPVDSLLSVFRRNFHVWHALRMQSTDNWPNSFCLECGARPIWGLYEFLSLERDCFGIRDHVTNWTSSTRNERGYPLLLIKYERLWDYLPELIAFLELPATALDSFPKKRKRSKLPQSLKGGRERLQKLFGDLEREIEALPDFQIV